MPAQQFEDGSATTFAVPACAYAVSPGNQWYRECAAPLSAVCGELAAPACVRTLRTSPAAQPLPRRSLPAPEAPGPRCLQYQLENAARTALPRIAPVALPGDIVPLVVARVPGPSAFARGRVYRSPVHMSLLCAMR